MKHLAPETLAEFIRRILPSAQQEAVNQHLLSCSRCSGLIDFFREIISVHSREAAYVPSAGVVRIVKAYFRTQEFAPARSKIELLFDSVSKLAPAGARAASAVSAIPKQQLLYRIGTIYIDMALGKQTNSDRTSLIGQMLDSSRPGSPPAGVPVILMSRGRSVARTASNDYGEFQFEFVAQRDLELAVAVNRDKPVCLPIATTPASTSRTPQHRKHKLNRSTRRPRKSTIAGH